jgi:NADH-quinone oxidoreductase subunit L
MFDLLWIVIALPFAGFAALFLFGSRMNKTAVSLVGIGIAGLALLTASLMTARFLLSPPEGGAYTRILWSWISVPGLTSAFSLRFDGLSVIMTMVVLFVGFLILLYSSDIMAKEEGYCRFFAVMNLFIGFMLVVVLANDLLFLFAGWEGVGLCSYLLIGFHYKNPDAIRASKKAFIVTRIGDVAFMIGLFFLANFLGTLEIPAVLHNAARLWPCGSFFPAAAALLLLIGALGKSAQIPLQIWLPDAMAGPTPVSALIHSATMVVAGVYLIARMHPLFLLAPYVLFLVAIIGAATLLLAGCAALAQRDIKRILAYSTISQIGYMFLALGVGAFSAAIFHFLTHAFFKSLLFLCAGVVIRYCNEEHDIFKMHGLRKNMPFVFIAFLIGSCSLAALPFITAGFFSKDEIILSAWSSSMGGKWLWLCAEVGAFLTALYTFRLLFKVFFGASYAGLPDTTGLRMKIPLLVLSIACLIGGLMLVPMSSAPNGIFALLIDGVFARAPAFGLSHRLQWALRMVSAILSCTGILFAWALFRQKSRVLYVFVERPPVSALVKFFKSGAAFDTLYSSFLTMPFLRFINNNRRDVTLFYVKACELSFSSLHYALSLAQTGKLRWYAMTIAVGAAAIMAIGAFH